MNRTLIFTILFINGLMTISAQTSGAVKAHTVWLEGISDASAIADVGDGYAFVADDETNVLRLYHTAQSGGAVREVDVTPMANGSQKQEYDLEAATVSDDGKTIYWIASLANSKKGKLRPFRNRAFSTLVNGRGATATLTAGAYTEDMRDALIAFGDANGWNFTASAGQQVAPKRIDGFNIEGLTLKKGGGTAYVAFRAPCVPMKGIAPTSDNRQYAVMAPVTNFERIFSVKGKSSVKPETGAPVLFDFGGLGIRAIERVGRYYVVVAGLSGVGGMARAYLWDGKTSGKSKPIVPGKGHLAQLDLDMSELSADGHPEGVTAKLEGDELVLAIVSDCGMKKTGKFRIDTFRIPLSVCKAGLKKK